MTIDAGTAMRYLTHADVVSACESIDVVDVVATATRLHADGRTTLPDEAYLPWSTPDGGPARSLALPAALWGERPAIGLKVINRSSANARNGVRSANGLTLLFDQWSARPVAIMDAARISALRTAAFSAVTVAALARPGFDTVAVLGLGEIGLTHLELLGQRWPDATFLAYDLDPARGATAETMAPKVRRATDAEEAVRAADVVVTATNVTEGYIPRGWLRDGALVAHVSLDDLLPDAALEADLLLVDDWQLVSGDTRRLLGRLHQAGRLAGPGAERADVHRVDATVGDVLAGRHPGRGTPDDVVVSNPFGMGLLDVAVASAVYDVAQDRDLGILLDA